MEPREEEDGKRGIDEGVVRQLSVCLLVANHNGHANPRREFANRRERGSEKERKL